MQTQDLGALRATELTYREWLEAALMAASMACDGKRSPEVHARHAIQGASALLRQQQERRS